jgi:hypothetical protein
LTRFDPRGSGVRRDPRHCVCGSATGTAVEVSTECGRARSRLPAADDERSGAGTYSGGWRIMRTLGRRIIDLDPPHGFAAEATASALLYTTAFAFAAPISTTQTITSSILGVGATRRLSAVRWIVARDIVLAWVLTIPMAALAAAATFTVLQLVFF